MNARRILLAVCWIVLFSVNVVLISVPIVSEPYIALKADRYKIEAVTDQAADALAEVATNELRVSIRSDDLAMLPLFPIGFVNLLGLLLLFWLGQTNRRVP